jgi:hypothetical protein
MIIFILCIMDTRRWNLEKGAIMIEKFVCALDCMDGRTKRAVMRDMRKHYGATIVDFITAPGINKILADGTDEHWMREIKRMIEVSVHRHESDVVAIVAHPKCAGNPCSKEEQIEHLKQAKKTVDGFGLDVDIILLWVCEDWKTVIRIDHPFSTVAS